MGIPYQKLSLSPLPATNLLTNLALLLEILIQTYFVLTSGGNNG